MSVRERQAEVVEEFSRLATWEDRYKKLIELGKSLPPLDDARKTEDARIRGCQSQVWMHGHLDGGRVRFEADSDAILVRGIVALLLRVYSDQSPTDIMTTPPDFVKQIGLESKLSPSRANGLFAMIKQMKYFALAFNAAASPR